MKPSKTQQRLVDLEIQIQLLHEMQAETTAWILAKLDGHPGDQKIQDAYLADYSRRLNELSKNYPATPPKPPHPNAHLN